MQLVKQQTEAKDKYSALFLFSTFYLFGLVGIIPGKMCSDNWVSIQNVGDAFHKVWMS